jgi:hypothetical protein
MRDENDWNSRFRRASRRLRTSGPSSPVICKSESTTLSPPPIVNSGMLRTIESPASNQAARFSQLIITRPLEAARHSGTFCKGIKLRDSRATGDFTSSFGVSRGSLGISLGFTGKSASKVTARKRASRKEPARLATPGSVIHVRHARLKSLMILTNKNAKPATLDRCNAAIAVSRCHTTQQTEKIVK